MSLTELIASRQRIRYNRQMRIAFQRLLLKDDGTPNALAVDVLGHLRNYCYADESTVKSDARGRFDVLASAAAQGRREVWLEINYYLHLSDITLDTLDLNFKQQMGALQQRGME